MLHTNCDVINERAYLRYCRSTIRLQKTMYGVLSCVALSQFPFKFRVQIL